MQTGTMHNALSAGTGKRAEGTYHHQNPGSRADDVSRSPDAAAACAVVGDLSATHAALKEEVDLHRCELSCLVRVCGYHSLAGTDANPL